MSAFNGVADEPAPQECPSCDGKGVWSYGETCWTCGGTGLVDADGFMFDPLADEEPPKAGKAP